MMMHPAFPALAARFIADLETYLIGHDDGAHAIPMRTPESRAYRAGWIDGLQSNEPS